MGQGDYLEAADKYMKLALKAQSQCRTTVEAIGELKNPQPFSFVQRTNIGNAVQVNNGTFCDRTPATRTGKNEKRAKRTIRGKAL